MTDLPGDELARIRAQIDRIDAEVQKLVSERGRLAVEVARIKAGMGEGGDCYRPEREAEILRQVRARNTGPLPDEHLTRLFREIMSACRALQQPLNVAFLGPEGTFTQDAVYRHFGHAIDTLPLGAIDEVFREVESGGAHYGVVPVENSTEGVITHTLDRFMNSPLAICGEVELRIHHQLLSKEKDLASVSRVLAHQQALAQCREWLSRNLPGVERVAVSSNAEGARQAVKSAGAAAIASRAAGEIHGLGILAANIEDEPDNTTRFLVIGTRTVAPTGDDKTSLVLSTPNRAGALARLIEPFARHGINMTRIESRPSRRGVWEYVFFVDVQGHAQEASVQQAIAALEAQATMVRVLGSYPRAIP